jgi:predicted deacylase
MSSIGSAIRFQGAQMATRPHRHVPVVVAKGAKPGKRAPLITGAYGDEISPAQVIGGPMGRTVKEAGTFRGDAFHTVRATHGGYLELKVDLRSRVGVGQVVAVQRNAFGEVVKEYRTEVAGEISTLQRDALIEPGHALGTGALRQPRSQMRWRRMCGRGGRLR